MNFEVALKGMNLGWKFQREEWSDKGVFIFIVAGSAWDFETDVEGVDDIETLPFICIKTAEDTLVPWFASQADVLATDWHIVPE